MTENRHNDSNLSPASETRGSSPQSPDSTLHTSRSALRTLRAYLQLVRPANVVTAWADVLAGIAAAGISLGMLIGQEPGILLEKSFWLLLATSGLYAGGVVFNDVFDAGLDAVERPERPIPSGRASRAGAIVFGSTLLIGGVLAARQAAWESGALAVFIALAALVYDWVGKHRTLLGPLNMGLCRGANLMLGVSIVPSSVIDLMPLALLPIVYIGAITAVSQGEVHGGTSRKGWIGVGLLLFVFVLLLSLTITSYGYAILYTFGFVAFLAWLVLPPFINAARTPGAPNIRKAVRAGVLGLVPLNATIAAGLSGWDFGLFILLLLPISMGLGKIFSVT